MILDSPGYCYGVKKVWLVSGKSYLKTLLQGALCAYSLLQGTLADHILGFTMG